MKRVALVAVALASLAALAGCGVKVNHDSPNPTEDVRIRWVRIETPPAFTTLMFGCMGKMGIYMDQGDGNANVNPDDPMCPISNVFNPAVQARYGFKVMIRTNGMSAGNS